MQIKIVIKAYLSRLLMIQANLNTVLQPAILEAKKAHKYCTLS